MKSCKPWDATVERLGGKEMTRAEVFDELFEHYVTACLLHDDGKVSGDYPAGILSSMMALGFSAEELEAARAKHNESIRATNRVINQLSN